MIVHEEAPDDWPEGIEVRIEPVPIAGSIGIRDEDWPDTTGRGSPGIWP